MDGRAAEVLPALRKARGRMRRHPIKLLLAGFCCAVAMSHLWHGDYQSAIFPLSATVCWLVSVWVDDE